MSRGPQELSKTQDSECAGLMAENGISNPKAQQASQWYHENRTVDRINDCRDVGTVRPAK